MQEVKKNDLELIELMNKHPHLKSRIEAILRVAEASVAGLVKADDVEMQVRESIRGLGQSTIEEWAKSQEMALARKTAEESGVKKHVKKNSIGTQHSE